MGKKIPDLDPGAEALFSTLIETSRQEGGGSSASEYLSLEQIRDLFLPVGAVIMWSGLVDEIPDGWALCDGSDGRPDLRDKFAIGAGLTYGPGDLAGSASHDHSGVTEGPGSTVNIAAGEGDVWAVADDTHNHVIEPANNLPPSVALSFIIRIA